MATIQEQIAQARNAGYDDAAITKHLSTLPDYSSKVKIALDSGYKPTDILSYLENPAAPEKRQNVGAEPDRGIIDKAIRKTLEKGGELATTGAGLYTGFGNLALGGQKLIGQGLSAIGIDKTGQALTEDAIRRQAMQQQFLKPYKEFAPNIAGISEFGGEVFNPITMAVPGVLANAMVKYAPNVAPTVANALRSGGFDIGVSRLANAPAGTVTNILPKTMVNRLTDTGARALGGGATGLALNALTSPNELESGATFGALAPVLLPPVGKAASSVLGKAVDLATGQTVMVEAGKRMRENAGQTINEIRAANNQAPLDITSAQATANITNDVWQAFNAFMQSKDKNSLYTIIDKKQDLANLETIAKLTGGDTATAIRQAIVDAKAALNELTTPLRKVEIKAANEANKVLNQINPKIEQKQASAIQALQQGGMAQTEAAQQANLASGGVISPRLGGTGNVSPSAYPVEGYPRIPASYTENQKRVPEFQGAAEDFAIVEAQRKAELAHLQYVKDSLAAHGMEPINTDNIIKNISAKLLDPKIGPSDVNTSVLSTVANKIKEWTALNGGVIDAEALYTIRKDAVNEAIAAKLGSNADPKASAKYAAELLGQIRPLIDDAIEKAGGTGWRNYLKTHEIGAHEINVQKLYGVISDMYRNNKQGLIKLVEGNDPDAIQNIFGYGNFDIVKELIKNEMRAGPAMNVGEKLKAVQKIAADTKRDTDIAEAASRGKDALDIKKLGFAEKIPGFVGYITAVVKKVAQTLEGKVETRITETIVNGLKNGKSANEILDTLPADDRIKALKALKNSTEWNALTGVAAERAINRNSLAPEQQNQNALAR
jgi:hypothetical protein